MSDMNNYQRAAMRTAKAGDPAFNLTHAALGLTGEAGEFADAIKKTVIYNKVLDHENAMEEIGDILWYCALACEALGLEMQEVANYNLGKLAARYPEKYTDLLAIQRLDKEGK